MRNRFRIQPWIRKTVAVGPTRVSRPRRRVSVFVVIFLSAFWYSYKPPSNPSGINREDTASLNGAVSAREGSNTFSDFDQNSSSHCESLPSGGHFLLVWAFNRPPSIAHLDFTLGRLKKYYGNKRTTVFCGSDECMRTTTELSHPCVSVQRLLVLELAKYTPLQRWSQDHVLAKLLSAHHFEQQLQAAMQLSALWKYGGVVLSLGVGPFEMIPNHEWVASNSPPLPEPQAESTCSSLKSGPQTVFMNTEHTELTGFLAVSAHSKAMFVSHVMSRMQEIYEEPYDTSRWPVKVDWEGLMHDALTNQTCCVDGTVSTVGGGEEECARTKHIHDARLEVADLKNVERGDNLRYYGTLSYNARRSYLQSVGNPGMNIGDEMQGLAGIQFLPYVDAFVERDRMDVIISTRISNYSNTETIPTTGIVYTSEATSTTIFLNAWYASPTWTWPPRPEIDPVLVAIHLQPGAARDKFAEEKSYAMKHGPIGARDLATYSFFASEKIPAVFTGCMTLTLTPWPKENHFSREEYLLVDVSEELLSQVLPEDILSKSIRLSHKSLDPKTNDDRLARYYEALLALKRYSRAKLVLTQRLHVALPCAAMGTPVVLLKAKSLPGGGGRSGMDRLNGLAELVHVFDSRDLGALVESATSFNWSYPPENPFEGRRLKLRNRLHILSFCNEDLRDSARKFGLIPSTWTSSDTRDVCSKHDRDSDAIHVATSIDMNWMSAFPTWLNALATENSENKVFVYVLTYQITPLVRCLFDWIGKRLLKKGEVFFISMDEVLQGTNYTPSEQHVGKISVATQARLYLSSLFSCVDKILWLDMDTLVLRSLQPLWNFEIDSACGIAGRSSIKKGVIRRMVGNLAVKLFKRSSDKYTGFNAGVMLMSLETLRKRKFEQTIVAYFTGLYGANDQVSYNMACNGTHKELPAHWNIFRSEPYDPVRKLPLDEWGIVHFSGAHKPVFMSEEDLKKQTGPEFRLWERYSLTLEEALSLEDE